VSADILPHYEIQDHRRVQAGFDLTLLAARSEQCAGDPGCNECQRVHELLREVACAALPVGWRHAVEPFDAAFHYRRETRWQPEIEAVVQLLPSDRTPDAADAALRAELREILERLHGVGVGEGKGATAGLAA
jgi:hypothetical protein